MTGAEQRTAAAKFAENQKGRSDEKQRF